MAYRFIGLFLGIALVSYACGGADAPDIANLNTPPSIAGVKIDGEPVAGATLTAVPEGWADAEGAAEAYTFVWFVDGKELAGQTEAELTSANFAKGQAVHAEVTPFDGELTGTAVASKPVFILNTKPTADSVSIGNGPYRTNDAITMTATGFSDADGDAEGFTYRWLKNGTAIAGQTAATLDGAHFSKGDLVVGEATPFDGEEGGTPVVSGATTIQNSTPAAVSADLGSGPVYVTNTITVQSVTGWQDEDGDAEGYQYAWYVGGMLQAAQFGNSLAGAFAKNDTVQAAVIPYDGSVTGSAIYSNTITIANSVPTVSAVSLGAGPFYETSTLTTAGVAADADAGDTPTIAYRWFVDGVLVAPTTSSLNGTYFSKGQTVAVEMTPYDGSVYGAPVLSAPVTIQNSLPSAASADIGAGPYYTNDTVSLLSVTGWSDADGDTESYRYLWYKNGVSMPAQTGTSLPGAQFSKGDVVSVRVTPYDGASGTPVVSNSVTIANSQPVITSVSLGAGPFSALSTLSAAVVSTDADGDTVTAQYAWFVDGLLVSGQSSQTLAGYFSRGATVVVNATVTEPFELPTPPSQSAPITIGNAAPTAPAVTVGPAQVTASTTVMYALVTTVATDIDGDPVTYAYAWLKNGAGYSTGSTTVAGPFTAGDKWEFTATPSDNQGGTGTATTVKTRVLEYASRVAAGDYHTCAVATTARLYCWGKNDYLQAGGASGNNLLEPTLVMSSAVSDVVAGNGGTCVLTTGGGVKCFGRNFLGSAGGSTATPRDVTGLTSGVRQIAATHEHACAVLSNGTVQCWGYCVGGACGPASGSSSQTTPVVVTGISDAVTIAVGQQHSCAITTGKTVMCWGLQDYGRLGNGVTYGAALGPTTVAGLTDIVAIGAGFGNTCAIKSDGQMYCWGTNWGFELGGTTPDPYWQTTPKLMKANDQSTLPATLMMTGGDRYIETVRADKTVWGWGSDSYTELGIYTDGIYAVNYYNAQATYLSNIVQMDAGTRHTCGVKATGGLVCWGSNYYANALGNGASSGMSTGLTPIGFVP